MAEKWPPRRVRVAIFQMADEPPNGLLAEQGEYLLGRGVSL